MKAGRQDFRESLWQGIAEARTLTKVRSPGAFLAGIHCFQEGHATLDVTGLPTSFSLLLADTCKTSMTPDSQYRNAERPKKTDCPSPTPC